LFRLIARFLRSLIAISVNLTNLEFLTSRRLLITLLLILIVLGRVTFDNFFQLRFFHQNGILVLLQHNFRA
jgi:hypothetical protein